MRHTFSFRVVGNDFSRTDLEAVLGTEAFNNNGVE